MDLSIMKKALIFLLFISTFGVAKAQILEPVKWEVTLSEENPSVDSEIEVIFKATIDKDWYLYSSDFDPDLGPMVTEIIFNPDNSFSFIGGIIPTDPKKKYDSLWEGDYTYFKGKGEFRQKIKIKDANFNITGLCTYQTCSEIDGKCILFEEDFELKKNDSSQSLEEPKSTDSFSIGSEESAFDVFLLALLAGIVALATPCVYPMIPMTVSIFMKQGGSKAKGLSMAAVFGGSIIILFTFIGFLVSLLFGFSALNELSTNWIFNLTLFSIFIAFALSFFGLFEITLPHSIVNKIDEQADRGGYVGVIFMAITLVVVSFSCTVPIVGTALLTALDGNILNGTVAMFGFSLAFAIPFTAFALFPSWLKGLPKSGGWLNSVKVVLGFLELALALKFLSIADLAYHWGILDREVFLALWIVIFSLLGLYLLGKIRFKSDSVIETLSISRLFLSIGVFSFVVYLIPGMFGAPLKSLAGFLPPTSTHDFNIMAVNQEEKAPLCEEPLYSDILHWPYGLNGYFDYDQAIACAQSQGKPIFVDFTGHGCVNCREMEQRVWSDPKVLERLGDNFVLLALYVDDKTELPESDWYKSKHDGKLKKTIGKQNADFQIIAFENNAQPFYLILDEKGDLLVNPKAYDLNVDNFVRFLDGGFKAYSQNN
ncbi:MAG: thioredoxin family protein [Cyclobacteriaceae bacterium]